MSEKYKYIARLILAWLLLLTADAGHGLCGESVSYRLLQDPWEPWTTGEFGPAAGGVSVDIATEIFRRMNSGVEVHLHPWNRILKMLEFGQGDGLLMVAGDACIDPKIVLSHPYIISRTCIYYNQKRFPAGFAWSKFEDFGSFTLGLVSGYSYGRFSLEIRRMQLRAEYARTPEVNLARLFAGRIDLLVGDMEVTKSLLLQNREWEAVVVSAEKPLLVREYSLGILRSSPLFERLPEIDAVIDVLKEDGTISRLREQAGQK